MLATFAFDVCHDVYRSAREVIDTKIPTLNLESSAKYTWHPDRLPRLAEYLADFARAGERALGGGTGDRGRKKCATHVLSEKYIDRVATERGDRGSAENEFVKNGSGEVGESEIGGERGGSSSVSAGGIACGGNCGGRFNFFPAAKEVKRKQADGSASLTTRADSTFGPFKPSRMAMFRVYYLGGAEYQAARRHLGISELTWGDWADEIRGCVGRELARSGVFPPSKYFREPSARAS